MESSAQERIHFFEKLSHVDLTALPKNKTAVFIVCSPLEEHGPHLPLGVDVHTAQYFVQKMIDEIISTKQDWHCLILPPIFLGVDTLDYVGSIEIPQYVVRDVLYHTAKKLAVDGFQKIILLGGHAGPRHVVVMEEVAAHISWRYRHTQMISASSKFLFEAVKGVLAQKTLERLKQNGSQVSAELETAIQTDFHAGLVETSLMMLARPELIREQFKNLKPAIISSAFRIRRSSAKKVGEGLGYLGSPALASEEIGKAISETIITEMMPSIYRFLEGAPGALREFRSKLYYVPFFRTHFRYLLIVLGATLMMIGSFMYVTKLFSQLAEVMK